MKALIIGFAVVASLTANSQRELVYPQRAFDSDTCCWRILSAQGKYQQAATLIVDYIDKGQPDNKHSLNWHAAQMFAFADNNRQAVLYINKTYNVFHKWLGGSEGRPWYYFAKGTKAFLQNDKEKLEHILQSWEESSLAKDKNYQELIRLSNNWGKNYREATFIK